MKRLITVIICASAMFACTPSSQPVNTATDVNVNENQAAITPATADLPANLQATEKLIEAQEPFGKFAIRYPSFGIETIDKTIEQYAQEVFEKGKANLKEQYEDSKDNLPPEVLEGYNYTMTYEVVHTSADGLDIAYTHEGYTGGAHGFFYITTQMLDKSGKLLALSDIYDDVPKALQHLSEESRRILPEMIKEMDGGNGDIEELRDMINDGSKPELENFEAILRTDKGLRIYFNPYQAAPWAVGLLVIDIDK